MSKAEKLMKVIDAVLAECEKNNELTLVVTMLRPILTAIISQMKDEDVDGFIMVVKNLVRYLEEDERAEKGVESCSTDSNAKVYNFPR